MAQKRHSFRPLLFAAPQAPKAPEALPPSSGRVRRRQDSHVRLNARSAGPPPEPDAQSFLDELVEDQMNLAMNLECLERLVESAPPGSHAPLRERTHRLATLRDALAALHTSAADRAVHAAFVPSAPLSDYLRGVYAWAHAVLRAVDDLTARLRERKADWAVYRWRIEEAKNFHFDELRPQIHADLAALVVVSGPAPVTALRNAVERVFVQADGLEEALDRRFG